MQDKQIYERRVIFRPYSLSGSDSNIFVCTGCGRQFTKHGDIGEMAMRFAEHLCEPITIASVDGVVGLTTH